MPAWPKPIFTLGASLLTSRTARKLRRKKRSVPEQNRVFRELTEKLGGTSFWKPFGVEAKMTYDQFKMLVAPRMYEDLLPAIERMKKGEANVLWPGQCSYYAVSSGTTAGRTKYLPITP